MVFNKFTHLARPSLSKAFAHGYAQSVVAATQSTTPFSPLSKHPSTKSGRPSTAQQHAPFSSVPTTASTSNRTSQPPTDTSQNDAGLRAYYDAWHRLQHGPDDKEWRQYQFPKLIEPKASNKRNDGKTKEQTLVPASLENDAERGALDRAYSASAVDDIKKAQDEAEEIAVAKVNEAIATVIDEIKISSAEPDEVQSTLGGPALQQIARSTEVAASSSRDASPTSLASREDVSVRSSPLSDVTTATSAPSDQDCLASLQRIKELNNAQAYKDIPPAFESLLSRGIKPTPDSYNALLNSAIHLPIGKLHVVHKALDIYTDMLRRKVSPNVTFYATLIQILSQQALYAEQRRVDLDQQSKRYGGRANSDKFSMSSHAAEYALVAEDDSLDNAMRLFNKAVSTHSECIFSSEMYQLLILACAQRQNVSDMVSVYQHLEAQHVTPTAAIFPAMITTFSKSGDLCSSLECYSEYRSLAIADDAGDYAIVGRLDVEVYAALVKAHILCGKADGGQRFLNRIVDNFATDTRERELQVQQIRDSVTVEAFVQQRLDAGDFSAASSIAESHLLSMQARHQAYIRICVTAADASDVEMATKAYQYLISESLVHTGATLAMLALYIRKQDFQAASETWAASGNMADFGPSLVIAAVAYANALILDGQAEKASSVAREIFARIRVSSFAKNAPAEAADLVDEAIETIAKAISGNGSTASRNASINLLWSMLENGGLILSVSEQALAALGPVEVSAMNWPDLIMVLQVQAGLIGKSTNVMDAINAARFGNLLDTAIKSGTALDERTIGLVDIAIRKLSPNYPEIATRWHSSKHISPEPTSYSFALSPSPIVQSPSLTVDNYDPHAATTDSRGSTIISEQLENHRNSHGLNEALIRFRNIRRAGRHPRYIAYAKLITAAAKEGRMNLTHDILGMARNDIPLLLQYPIVRHGWASILDAMVGACLMVGRRTLAEQYHQELLDTGSAPTANTYGLYITTLKESTRTFDEATEAVKIFHRAVAESVQPSSFLYNALIGKLGKARRIDDCLRYFQEMRVAGIRPTSVTYGTVVNALCRVSDERFAEELFDEMESASNYKPRPAPYNSLMQYFLTTKRDSQKVLAYYDRMRSMKIQPTMHTYKLLIDTHATLEPINLEAAEGVLETIRAQGLRPEAVHYASLIHAKGCALHDMEGARKVFDDVLSSGHVKPHACLYQALFESMVANHYVGNTEEVLDSMSANQVEMTPYIANTLIHGWAIENQIAKSKAIYDSVGIDKREPSTYESMTRAFLTAEDRKSAVATVHEMLSRGYPSAVVNKILELVGPGAM